MDQDVGSDLDSGNERNVSSAKSYKRRDSIVSVTRSRLLMTTIRSEIMGMPSWFESSSPDLRLDSADMNTWNAGARNESSGTIGAHHDSENTTVAATQGDYSQDTPPPSRTVRKKKSSYDLRDEFQHPECFTAPPDLIVSAGNTATACDPEGIIQPSESPRTQSGMANRGQGGQEVLKSH